MAGKHLFICREVDALGVAYELTVSGAEVEMYIHEDPSLTVGQGMVGRVPSWRPLLGWADYVHVDSWLLATQHDVFERAGCAILHSAPRMDYMFLYRGRDAFERLGIDMAPAPVDTMNPLLLLGLFSHRRGWCEEVALVAQGFGAYTMRVIPIEAQICRRLLAPLTAPLQRLGYTGAFPLHVSITNQEVFPIAQPMQIPYDVLDGLFGVSRLRAVDLVGALVAGELRSIEPTDLYAQGMDLFDSNHTERLPRVFGSIHPRGMYKTEGVYRTLPNSSWMGLAVGAGASPDEACHAVARNIMDMRFSKNVYTRSAITPVPEFYFGVDEHEVMLNA